MCGITGYFGQGNQDILKKMNDTLRHRGPDDEGFFVHDNVGLAQRRLSIIDLSPAGHQPMSNEDGTIWISFNGEIYNYQDLKPELAGRHKFRGSSDTEVIIHLYEEIGEKVFEKIQGMFAIALYDQRIHKLILARDRMGKKPLYWGIFNNTLLFGSELKALMAHPAFKKELDLKSLNKYLQYEYVPTPHTILKNVFKLEPGHALVYDGRETIKKKFWDINFFHNSEFRIQNSNSFTDAMSKLDSILNTAVTSRLVSDVPLGIFLSGGIDSSTVAYYAQKNSSQKIKTFSIGFTEDSFDESQYARQVAAHLGTDHHEQILSARDSLDIIPRIADLLDEPMADASILPTYLLSRFTRQHVTVALGGDAGDELFCGYDTFVAHRLAEYYEKIPLFIRRQIIEKIALRLPTSFTNLSFDFKAKKFIGGYYGEKKYRNQRWLGSFDREERARLFVPEVWNNIALEKEFEDIDNYLENSGDIGYYQQLILLYLRTYMMDDILVKVDRASMYNSLEVRAPFLDTSVVDLANSLPMNYKLHGFQTKYILKKLMEDKLPRDIVYRQKKGFGIPLSQWLTTDLRPLIEDIFSPDHIEQQGLFDYGYISKLLSDHFSRRADNRKLIWTLAVFQLWFGKWMKE